MDWIYCPRSAAAAPLRLFCFPFAGSALTAYSGWEKSFQPDAGVCVVVPPGREMRCREKPLDRMDAIAAAVADAMVPHLDRPFVFFGHSFGALVSFEVARELRRRGLPLPLRLFASAAPGPQTAWPHHDLHKLDEQGFLDKLNSLYNKIPKAVLDDPELRAIVLPALRADLTAVETYRYQAEPPLDCPVTAFAGQGDHVIPPDLVAGWNRQTASDFRFHVVPGDHFYLKTALEEIRRHVLADLVDCAQPR